MNRDPQLPAGSGDEESWESLAENLFGIEFRKIPDPGEIISPEDLEELEGLTDVPEPTDEEIDSAIAETDEPLEDEVTTEIEGEVESSELDENTAVEPAEDTFWDALKDWTWDESEDHSESDDAAAPRGRGPRGRRDERSGRGPKREDRGPRRDDRETRRAKPVDPSATSSRDVPTASDLHTESVDDADFGFGLLDGEQPPEPRRDPSASWEGKQARDEKKEPVSRSAAEPRSDREASSKGGEWKPRREPPQPAEIDDDDFGADLGIDARDTIGEESSEESSPKSGESDGDRPRRRRRRRGRRRSERREPERPAETSNVEDEEFEGIEVEIDSEELAETDDVAGEEGEDEGREERGPRRRRRGRRRGRGRDRDDRSPAGETSRSEEPRHPDESKEVAVPEAEGWDDELDVAESEEDADAVPSYANVPTWEQAIEYLLHPGQAPKSRDAESGSASPGEKPARESRRGRGRRRR